MSELIAVLQEIRGYPAIAVHRGFIHREIKTFEVEYAPSYNGKGPYRKRTFTYVDINDARWPLSLRYFISEDDKELRIQSVTLLRSSCVPKLAQLENMTYNG